MKKLDMRCVSTYFQPRKNHNNATYMNKHPDKAPSQIDHVIVSSRWASSVRYCEVRWGIPINVYGRKYDHKLSSVSNYDLKQIEEINAKTSIRCVNLKPLQFTMTPSNLCLLKTITRKVQPKS